MSVGLDTTQRFLRPPDIGRIRRNQRRIQVQRLLVILRNTLLVIAGLAGALWVYRQTQSDARFAVRRIELAGIVHTPRAAVDPIVRQYAGLNLFRIDIARVQHDLGAIAWIRRIEIEKNLPDTLRIHVVERVPVALIRNGMKLDYVDDSGVAFSRLSPDVGDNDLPLIVDAAEGDDLKRTVEFLRDLRVRDRELYSRLSEIQPLPPRGFAVFDRELAATVHLNSDDAVAKWRVLHAIARSEKFARGTIAYADLRFADRIVIKPIHPIEINAPRMPSQPAVPITN